MRILTILASLNVYFCELKYLHSEITTRYNIILIMVNIRKIGRENGMLRSLGGFVDSGIDGVNQWPTVSRNAPSARGEIVHNIDEVTSTSSIR